jgi:hypothetical protein
MHSKPRSRSSLAFVLFAFALLAFTTGLFLAISTSTYSVVATVSAFDHLKDAPLADSGYNQAALRQILTNLAIYSLLAVVTIVLSIIASRFVRVREIERQYEPSRRRQTSTIAKVEPEPTIAQAEFEPITSRSHANFSDDRPLPPIDSVVGAAPLGAAPLAESPAPLGASALGSAPLGAAPLGASTLSVSPVPPAAIIPPPAVAPPTPPVRPTLEVAAERVSTTPLYSEGQSGNTAESSDAPPKPVAHPTPALAAAETSTSEATKARKPVTYSSGQLVAIISATITVILAAVAIAGLFFTNAIGISETQLLIALLVLGLLILGLQVLAITAMAGLVAKRFRSNASPILI